MRQGSRPLPTHPPNFMTLVGLGFCFFCRLSSEYPRIEVCVLGLRDLGKARGLCFGIWGRFCCELVWAGPPLGRGPTAEKWFGRAQTGSSRTICELFGLWASRTISGLFGLLRTISEKWCGRSPKRLRNGLQGAEKGSERVWENQKWSRNGPGEPPKSPEP